MLILIMKKVVILKGEIGERSAYLRKGKKKEKLILI